MSARDGDRWKVLHEVGKGPITQKHGGEQLGVTERWVRTLVARMRKEGDGGILHRLRGRVSNRKIPEKTRQKAVKWVQGKYADLGPALRDGERDWAKREGVAVSKETLRQWLIEAGVWRPKKRRVEAVHAWRARRSCRGELGCEWSSGWTGRWRCGSGAAPWPSPGAKPRPPPSPWPGRCRPQRRGRRRGTGRRIGAGWKGSICGEPHPFGPEFCRLWSS